MKLLLYNILLSLALPATSTFVVQCYSRLFDHRADPVVSPGVPSAHVHTISGGNGFNFSMTYEQARASRCSTCNIKQDLSNYWSPKLYFHAKNGSFISVPIVGDNEGGNMGGMAIYYLTRSGPDNDKLIAFPPGFRMLAGDPNKRVATDDFAGRAVSHKCVGGENPSAPDETKNLPTQKCDQIRVQVTFPSCWDGENTDSVNHKSHVSYPKDGNFDGGRCPATHPKHLVTLFYEVYYDTSTFRGEWDSSNKQPFVFANGDATGYGYHGDFVNGWPTALLQTALSTCIDGTPTCSTTVFGSFRTQAETQACKLPSLIAEPVSGVLSSLPGCNPVTYGPEPAVVVQNCAIPQILEPGTEQAAGFTDVRSLGWRYMGCAKDDAGRRTLDVEQISGNDMTVEKCIEFCKSKNIQYAGLEYSGECYCGDSVAEERKPVEGEWGNCVMKCSGNATQVCGGPGAISLYQACGSGGSLRIAKSSR
ncbi:WSC-domain-containing protein [Delitschia confertaspora ATCC 74209]|uniref:WSC-domain-containing protein n=1 Tax=Delitschia confertaspora ATCC 74209 TaxID=1513339 RepID=A0A9P4MZ97_9PLEO|nr:WSC-domain-containing protein [Delitschia confertaspora ATCC 74209]